MLLSTGADNCPLTPLMMALARYSSSCAELSRAPDCTTSCSSETLTAWGFFLGAFFLAALAAAFCRAPCP